MTIGKWMIRAEAAAGLALASTLVHLVPFRWWRSSLGPLGQDSAPPASLNEEQKRRAIAIGRLVRRVAERLPLDAACLPQAMVGRWMLARRGIPARIALGSRRSDTAAAGFLMHAWLIADDRIVTGGKGLEGFSPLQKGGGPAPG
ncbi:lasso peptide biosynthesis B2 protein [Sphingomonas sp. ST-64]|uniref:Lasso peptide biosynthesis B2 protein n=1 Tax=Sphingomonas plantiphila TaxID=3163295 RepID=A0ABW8YJQ3_9SPHN